MGNHEGVTNGGSSTVTEKPVTVQPQGGSAARPSRAPKNKENDRRSHNMRWVAGGTIVLLAAGAAGGILVYDKVYEKHPPKPIPVPKEVTGAQQDGLNLIYGETKAAGTCLPVRIGTLVLKDTATVRRNPTILQGISADKNVDAALIPKGQVNKINGVYEFTRNGQTWDQVSVAKLSGAADDGRVLNNSRFVIANSTGVSFTAASTRESCASFDQSGNMVAVGTNIAIGWSSLRAESIQADDQAQKAGQDALIAHPSPAAHSGS